MATDWYLLAWKSFGAREFSYDEARKMAMAHGADADELRNRHKLLSRKGDSVTLLQPSQREGSESRQPGCRHVHPRSGRAPYGHVALRPGGRPQLPPVPPRARA